ncbi:MAG: S41 family peptidase [Chitinophagales bacterium]
MARVFTILLLISTLLYHGQAEKLYSVADLKYDIAFLKQKLEVHHPNLYLYTDKKIIDSVFDRLTNSITEPMTEWEFYKHITIVSSVIKDGHTIILPSSYTTAYHNTNSKFLPYKLRLIGNCLFTEMVLTGNSTIQEGAEITAINGQDAQTIIHQLTERQVRDGYNETYPAWIINNYFREYYSYIYGHPAEFTIQYRINNTNFETTVAGLSKDSISYYRQLKYSDQVSVNQPNGGIVFQIFPNSDYAKLTIKDFHGSVLRKEYHQNFKTEIKKAFQQLTDKKIDHLILDLRNNQGGDVKYGVYLLSYLLQQNFCVVEQYYHVLHKTSTYQLVKTNGEEAGVHKPKDRSFKGKLYVLINGGSFSNSGIVASALKQYGRATFIGNETGGSNKVLAGWTKDYSLPNTKIHIEAPTKQFMLNEKLPLTGHGTMPDYEINEVIEDVLNKQDKALDLVVKLLTDQKKGR